MIIFVEGPRTAGKTTLIENFFKHNTNPDIIYYKFYFAKYLEEFDIKKWDSGAGVHYFSIANILTILELNETVLKDKILVFDRSIFSAYTWSILRKRMEVEDLLSEFEKILKSTLYHDCTLLFLTKFGDRSSKSNKRVKDYFDQFEDYELELKIFNQIIDGFKKYIVNPKKNNKYQEFVNTFDEESMVNFNELLSNLTSVKNK
jgi:thymidylate kinase